MSKKHTSMTKLLEGVLTPFEKQPYLIPENWLWVEFGSVIKTSSNKAKAIKQKDYDITGEIPVIDQSANLISGFTNNIDHLYTGKLPVIVFGDHTRCVKWIDFPFAQGADGTKLLKILEQLHSKYFYYLIQSLYIPDKGYSRHFKYLKENALPLPPLNEQKRIAEKVERLLGKIDEAKRLIDEAKETFELRRAAILDEFFGREFKDEYGITSSSYIWKSVEELCELISDCPHSTPKYTEDGIYPAIRSSDISQGKVELTNAKRVTEEDYLKRISRATPLKGDIIYCREGSGEIGKAIGKAGILLEGKVCLAQRVVLLRADSKKILPKYFSYALNSPTVLKQVSLNVIQTTSPRINVGVLKKLKIPVASINMQKDIIAKVERLFEIEEDAYQQVISIEKKIEFIKQSILSKAFRGELGTNTPTEESAIELLKSVLQEKVT